MTTCRLQAEDMIKRHGFERALETARSFTRSNDPKSREFWRHVVVWLEHIERSGSE